MKGKSSRQGGIRGKRKSGRRWKAVVAVSPIHSKEEMEVREAECMRKGSDGMQEAVWYRERQETDGKAHV